MIAQARFRRGALRHWLSCLVAGLTIAAAGCSAGGSPTAPTGATLTLTTSTTSLSANGSAVITAQLLTSAGQPQANVAVAFSASIGALDPPELVTDASGLATTVFSAGAASGTAVVSARSGNISAAPLNLTVGAASVGRVLVAAEPGSLPATGGASTITATVTDAKGNPLATMPVAFSTTAGTVVPGNAKTDANGQVLTTLTSKASAVVTAVAGITPNNGSAAVSVSGSVSVPLGARAQPVVTITPGDSPMAGTPTTFTLGVTPAAGGTATIQNVTIWFGDGDSVNLGAATGTAITAQHTYAVGGTYTVTVTATDSAGGTTTASTVVAVGFTAPLAVTVTGGPMSPAGGGPNTIVTLMATVAPPGAVITSYQWDFGDGQTQTTTANQLQHLYASAGLYTVTVIATDAATGMTATGSVPVSTASARPTVTVAASPSPVAGSATTFTVGVIPAPGSNTAISSVKVDYGDGTAAVDLGGVSGAASTAQHVYANPGTFTVTVTAIDTGGGLATASTVVVIGASTGPTVTVAASPGAIVGAPVTFTATAAPGPTGATLVNVLLDFGDNSPTTSLGAAGNAPISTQHVYANVGTYWVLATAVDINGATGVSSVQIVVSAPGAPTVSVSASANPVVNTVTTLTVTASAPAGATITGAVLSFGDGGTANLGAISGSASAQHTYTSAGTFTASVTVTTSAGVSATGSTPVVVAAAPSPTVSISAPSGVTSQTVATFTINTTPARPSTAVTNVQVSFGDGSPSVNLGAVGATATTQHVFTGAGTFTVTATATDSGGGTATASTAVVVLAPLQVSVTAGVNRYTLIQTPFTISVTPAPGITLQNVTVNWGDGSSEGLGNIGTSPVQRPHVYSSAGNYTITVTATAAGGVSVDGSTAIFVAALPAVTVDLQLISEVPSVLFSEVTLRTIVNPPAGLVTVVSAILDFGNGASTGVSVGTVDHLRVYGWVPTYTATLLVVDSVGRAFSDQVTFTPGP